MAVMDTRFCPYDKGAATHFRSQGRRGRARAVKISEHLRGSRVDRKIKTMIIDSRQRSASKLQRKRSQRQISGEEMDNDEKIALKAACLQAAATLVAALPRPRSTSREAVAADTGNCVRHARDLFGKLTGESWD
jgi:hypothetical protein